MNRIDVNTFHRVKLREQDSWSLFVRTGTETRWGFLGQAERHDAVSLNASKEYHSWRPLDEVWIYAPHPGELTDAAGGWDDLPRGNGAGRQPLELRGQ